MKTTTKNYWPQIAIVFLFFGGLPKEFGMAHSLRRQKLLWRERKKWYLLMLDI